MGWLSSVFALFLRLNIERILAKPNRECALMTNGNWQTYEDVARYLLEKLSDKYKLSHVEGMQIIFGYLTGTDWEIDAKAIKVLNETYN